MGKLESSIERIRNEAKKAREKEEQVKQEEQKCDSCDRATCDKTSFPGERCSRRPN